MTMKILIEWVGLLVLHAEGILELEIPHFLGLTAEGMHWRSDDATATY